MTDIVTSELLLEVLKDIQQKVSRLVEENKEVKQGLMRIREETHGLRGDVLSLARRVAGVEARLDRVELRLGLTEVEH